MTIASIEESSLKGIIDAPSSKSYTHRAIIAASLSEGLSKIRFPLYSEDIAATIDACKSFGVSVTELKSELNIIGSVRLKAPLTVINCGNSASTLRFLTPIAALAKGKTIIDGSLRLRERPIGPLLKALERLKVTYSSHNGFLPITVDGDTLEGGKTSIVGDVSSQFITGLLFACPLAKNDTEITLTTPLESKPYVELTMHILKNHNIVINTLENFRKFNIPNNQQYTSYDHKVPGDFSSAAFLLAAAAITNSEVTIKNLFSNQPDSEIVNILSKMGASILATSNSIRISSGRLKGINIDAKDTPDLVPACATLACFSDGETHIYHAKRLRLKESDRLTSLSLELQKMGGNIVEKDDELVIRGPNKLRGATIIPHQDHRIAMACSIAALKAKGRTIILEAECVEKSYPNFFTDLKKLGAKIDVK